MLGGRLVRTARPQLEIVFQRAFDRGLGRRRGHQQKLALGLVDGAQDLVIVVALERALRGRPGFADRALLLQILLCRVDARRESREIVGALAAH